MKVLLISANRLTEPYPVYPLGLDYVVAALGKEHTTRILDLHQIPDKSELETVVRNDRPDLIGLSLRNADNTDLSNPMGFMTEYADLVKALRHASSAPLVLGGSGFTIFPNEAMELLGADYGIMGEGERLPLLLEALEQDNDPSRIEGVVVRGIPARKPPVWSHPFKRRFDIEAPNLVYYLNHGGMLNLQTKRGCPFRCVYCTYPHIEGRKMRLVDPEEVARTALELEAAGAKYFFITDSAFNAHMEHSLAVARAFKKVGVSIPWGAFFAPTHMVDDYFHIMAECGLRHVEFGTESLNDAVLAAYGKPFRSEAVFKTHDLARKAGLHTAHYLLFGGPGEDNQTLDDTLTRIEQLDKCVVFMFCGMRIYPHTALYDLAVAQNQIDSQQSLVAPVFYRSPGIAAETIMETISERSKGRSNWVVGAGSPETIRITKRMYQKGYAGPLWEYLCR
jgi:radical SAM superfamily enzyme YgiQ (UPF0313 family)